MSFLLRLCCAALSAYIFTLFMWFPAHLLYLVSPDREWFWYADVVFKMRLIAGALWMASWGILEFRSSKRSSERNPRLLTHLRYGPVAILVFSVVTVAAYDVFLIQYSRWEIVCYIHSDAPVTEEPSFKLHNNNRSFCGNGMAANRYYLYGDTPAAYIDAQDAATRARALRASMRVYDWINHPDDGPSIDALKKALEDPDPMVREIAAKFSAELNY